MSIFGKMDAATIPANPFFVAAGEYLAEVTKAEFKKNRDGKSQLYIEYTIIDESQYQDSKVQQFFTLMDPEMTAEAFELLPASEQQAIRRSNASIKRTLCGSDTNSSQKGLGVLAEDLNDPEWTPESVVGTKVNIGVANNGANNEYVNIKWVNLAE